MAGDADFDLDKLRALLDLPKPASEEPTPFAQSVIAALTEAVASLRAGGMIEVEDDKVEGLTNEVVEAALESTSLKKLPLRLVKTLIHSEQVEEVYGTDEEISAALRPFLDRI